MRLRSVILLLSLLLGMTLTGCSGTKLYLLDKQDIFSMEPDNKYETDRKGWFISDVYMKKVMKTKVN